MTQPQTIPPGPAKQQLLKDLKLIRDHPHEYLLQSAKAYGDVVRFSVPGNQAYFINHPDHVKHVLQMNHRNYDKNTFQYNALSRITGQGLLTNVDAEDWLEKRRIAQPAFSKQSLQGIVPIVTASTRAMLADWEENIKGGALIDIDREMMKVALAVVAQTLFGADLSEQAHRLTGAVMEALDYLIYQTRTLGMVPGWLPIRQNRNFKQACQKIENVVNDLIDRRPPDNPGQDFLGILIGARDEAGTPILSRKEIRDEVITMLIAGHETVASSLTWSWLLLSRNPGTREKIRLEAQQVLGDRQPTYEDYQQLTYTRQAYHEALRLYPPAWLISRRAIGEDQLGEFSIPGGALVIISPYTLHRRPDLWPDPDIFDPARFSETASKGRHRFGFIPFGGGPRLCIGNRFAIIEATLILAMVSRVCSLDLPPGAEVRVEALVTMRPHGGLPMKLNPL